MYVLLILGACFCGGHSYGMLRYGDYFSMILSRKAQYIEFTSSETRETSIIWKRGEPPTDSRQHVTYASFNLKNLTQKDSGDYIQRDNNGENLFVKVLWIEAHKYAYTRTVGDDFRFTYDLQPSSCNIYFHPENENSRMDEIVHQGLPHYYKKCQGFEVLRPCGIVFESLTVSCKGRFSVRDSSGSTALEVSLEIESQGSGIDTKKLGLGLSITFTILSCCGCLKHCCCGKSKKEDSETPEDEDPPPVYYHECDDNDPNGPEPDPLNPLSETPYPSQPSYTQTGPLIHEPPTTLPPSYSEVFGLAEPTCLSSGSDSEPRFELRGMSLPSSSDVYTSDKLSFLSKP